MITRTLTAGLPVAVEAAVQVLVRSAVAENHDHLIRRSPRELKRIDSDHVATMSNGPTEVLDNLVKRIGFGFRDFENDCIRSFLYAGKPNWRVLGSIVLR